MPSLDFSEEHENAFPKPILEWLVRVLEQNYNNNNPTAIPNGINVKKIIFYDVLQILQYCKDDTMRINKYRLSLKMKTKKYKNKQTGLFSLLLCLYGNLPLIVDEALVQVPVQIFIPNENTYKITKSPVIVLDIESLLKENMENIVLKDWIKDEVKFNDHYIDTNAWLDLNLSQRTLISFIDITVKYMQLSLAAFEHNYELSCREQVPVVTKVKDTLKLNAEMVNDKFTEINILDNVELEQKISNDLKNQKAKAIEDLQRMLNSINDSAVPKINDLKLKRKGQLQDLINFYSNLLTSYEDKKFSKNFINDVVGDDTFNRFNCLERIHHHEKRIQDRSLNELIDIENILYSNEYESWLLESEIKSKSFDDLIDLVERQFIEKRKENMLSKTQDLIDISDNAHETIFSSTLNEEIKTIEILASQQFNAKYDICQYNSFKTK